MRIVHAFSDKGRSSKPPRNRVGLFVIIVFPGLFVLALLLHNIQTLDLVHVFSGTLWTAWDLFIGFMLRPILKKMTPDSRARFTAKVIPNMVFTYPVLVVITIWGGWILAHWDGVLKPMEHIPGAFTATIGITSILVIQGVLWFVPSNYKLLQEYRKSHPDTEKIQRYFNSYQTGAAIQGLCQVAIVILMARFTWYA